MTDPPGTAVVTPSVFVIPRFACGVNVSVSVAELLAPFGSVVPPGAATVAVFTRVPVADAEIVADTVNVMLNAQTDLQRFSQALRGARSDRLSESERVER